ncbi:neurogenic protein mastermind isoform X6 [Athalia rosae]|uniref:neurogenic protein mastermind isoform X6 n=1 Tax=Athalia rosae TaxID=37344 RepID=UPI0020339DFD|nr:neurogenic protein mastermind isoform X6 [Athalia rosae]
MMVRTCADVGSYLTNGRLGNQKFLKRTAEELEPTGGGSGDGGFGEPPSKLQCTQAQQHQQQQHQQQQQAPGSGGGGGGGGGPHHGHGQQQQHQQPGNGANSSGPQQQQQQQQQQGGNEGLTKFSVEIVQQLEFTTSAANSQPQQISTNVTVKALTNASVKSDHVNSASPKSGPDTPASATSRTQGGGGGIGCVDLGNLVECKQEPDNEFVDLEQCAAALEKDAAANGAGFPGFSDFIGDDTGDEIITSDAFKDLISEISDFHPEFMKDFDFEDKGVDTLANNAANNVAVNNGQIKVEDDKDAIHQHNNNNGTTLPSNSSPGALGSSQYSPARLPYSGLDFKTEMSPAAQTLKQMAEQHQHKNQQLGLGGFNPTSAATRGPAARSPYAEFPQFGGASDYLGSPGSNGPPGPGQPQTAQTTGAYHKPNNTANFQNQQTADMFAAQSQFSGIGDMKRAQTAGGKPTMMGPTGGYKQQYSPYGSPGSMPNHGSPGYPLPPRGAQAGGGPNQTGSQGPFTSSTPPRPPSGPGTSTLQINQAQQLHISNPGHQIQVSAGQHMQLTGDLKPGVSVAAQQGMYFSQQQAQNQSGPAGGQGDTYCSVSQSQTINFTQQSLRQRAAATGGVPQPGGAAGARGHPQQVPPNQVDHQHAKLIQQQQMMRAQQVMQQQHMAGGMGGVRPPPPEYKAAQAQMMHAGIGMGGQARFPTAGPMRRVTQQAMPPSGPMMRSPMAQQQQQQALHAAGGNMYMGAGGMSAIGGMHQMHQRLGYPRTNNQRPPNVSVGPPDGIGNSIAGRGAPQEWRHIMMHQQQGFQAQMRPQFNQQGHQGGFGMGGAGGMQMSAAQMQHQQLIRSQSGGMGGAGMANSSQMQQLLSQQHQQQSLAMQQSNNQMSVQMQMSQSTSVNSVSSAGTGSPLHPHQQYGSGSPGVRSLPQQQQQQQSQPPPTPQDSSVATAADFSLEFLENLPTGDTSNFSAQELLNSLDSTAGFNLDIL